MEEILSSLILHEDVFYEYFIPYRHPKAQHNIWGGLGLETFAEDMTLVRNIDSKHVWTVLDGERNDQWIVPGVHRVNRVCYLVSVRPHNHLNVEFSIRHRAAPLTKLGLQRQLKVLQRAVDQVNVHI
jgi:hypothetical protein